MRSRRLRVLRIDDDLPKEPFTAAPSERLKKETFPHVDLVRVRIGSEERLGIASWEMAVEYWKSTQATAPVDVIVADVRFKDESSPLAGLAHRLAIPAPGSLYLPTGLSHVKAFAAIARATGSPIGIAVHTAESNTWKELLRSEEPIEHVLALLAAHEVGELAAILGQGEQIANKQDMAKLESCWDWLRSNTASSWRPAVCHGLQGFRRSLHGRRAPPREWLALAKWCERMKDGGVPLAKDDPGLPLLIGTGKEDRISFCSIFADVEYEKPGFRFDLEALPARCFDLAPCTEYFLLDDERFPRIGSLIREMGDLTLAYPAALEILKSFSPPAKGCPPRTSLESVVADGLHDLPAALAIALMSIRREHEYFKEWERAYRTYDFNVRSCLFDPDVQARKGKSLSDLMHSCYSIIQAQKIEEPSSEDIQRIFREKVPGLSTDTYRLVIKLLHSLGCLQEPTSEGLLKIRRGRNGEMRINQKTLMVPRVPPLPSALKASLVLDEIYFGSPFPFLAVAFGDSEKYEQYYGMGKGARKNININDLGRVLARGFERKAAEKNETPKKGRELLKRLWQGDANVIPGLGEVCRMYAEEELKWSSASTWPLWLMAVAGANKVQS